MLRYNHAASGLYLGTIGDVSVPRLGRHSMKVSVDVNAFKTQSDFALRNKPPCEIYNQIIKGRDGFKFPETTLELEFTHQKAWDAMKGKANIAIIKVLKYENIMHEHTVLEVNVDGSPPMVLRCLECRMEDVLNDRVQTIAQKDAEYYDNLPEKMKDIFFKKFAQGHLWVGNSGYEVILMEHMSMSSLNQGFLETRIGSERYAWLSQAFGLLNKMHVEGFSHGNAYADSLLWSEGSRKGTLKFINPDRALDISQLDNETKVIRKLNDILFLFFDNFMAYYGLNPSKYADKINYDILHSRLSAIKVQCVSRGTGQYFFLDEVLPFSNILISANVKGPMIDSIKNKLKDANLAQYQKMKDITLNNKIDGFTLSLADPVYLEKVFSYIIKEINRSNQGAALDESDYDIPLPPGVSIPKPLPTTPPVVIVTNIPAQTPLPPPASTPPVVNNPGQPQPSPQRPGPASFPSAIDPRQPQRPGPASFPAANDPRVQPQRPGPASFPAANDPRVQPQRPGPASAPSAFNVVSNNSMFPLMYNGFILQLVTGSISARNADFLEIYYTIDVSGNILLKVPKHQLGTYENISSDTVREVHAEGRQLLAPDGEKLYFNINTNDKTLMIYKAQRSNLPPYTASKLVTFYYVPLVSRSRLPVFASISPPKA